MKIQSIEIYKMPIAMEPFVIATGVMDYAQNLLVKIVTDEGGYGVGECSAFPMIVGETQETCFVVAQDLARLCLGKNPLDISERMHDFHRYISGNSTVKSAFDMALHDLAAKHEQVPLYRYLGGERRVISTDITIGMGTPDQMARAAKTLYDSQAVALKIKLGESPQQDIERMRAIRLAVGFDIPVRIDANQGWSYEEAVEALSGMEPLKVQFCEQPMRKFEDHLLPQLRSETIIPIMADESVYDHHDAERLCRTDSVDFINIKFSKSSGILEALKIQEIAAEYGIPCMIGGMLESRLALAAKVHFAYAASNIKFFDLDTCMVGHLEDPVIGGAIYRGYQVSVDDSPGIGADIDSDFLEKCEMTRLNFE